MIDYTTLPSLAVSGDVPLPHEGATLNFINETTAVLIGGNTQPHMFKSPKEIFVKKFNIFEQRTLSNIHLLIIDMGHYTWEKVGNLPVPLSYHCTNFCEETKTLIVLGGLSSESSSSLIPGERQDLGTVFILDVTSFNIIRKITTNTSILSGMGSFLVNNQSQEYI